MTYTCNTCGKQASTKEALYEHLKKWHSALTKKAKERLYKAYKHNRKR